MEKYDFWQSTARDPVTPPLLPLSPPFLPYIPSSDTGQLEYLSDHSSPTRQEILKIDQMLNDKDAIISTKRKRRPSFQDSGPLLLDSSNVEDIYSPLKGIQDPPSSPPVKKRSLQDRKVEVPLTRLACELPLPDKMKKVTFSDVVLKTTPNFPSLIADEDISSDDINAFFAEIIEPIGIKAERSIEQEQLQATNTELRVPIPIMDFSRPKTPWKLLNQDTSAQNGNASSKKILSELKKVLSKHVWPAVGQSEQELRWNPFPAQAGRFEPQDTFSDDESTSKLLEQPECIDSETLTGKLEGLRILDDLADIDDEELEVGEFPTANDTNSLIHRRKLELEKENAFATAAEKSSVLESRLDNDSGVASSAAEIAAVNEKLTHDRSDNGATNNLFTSFSALNELENFMCIRSGVYQKPKLTVDDCLSDKFSKAPRDTSQEKTIARTSISMTSNPLVATLSSPAPQFALPTVPHPFVVSNLFLRDRKLARRIQKLYPAAELIERDYTLYYSAKQGMTLGKPPTVQPAKNMANEADMILSPSTGLIWTTLLKIKQQSLPGQAARSAIRESITQAAPRYERLLILVSQDSNLDSTSEATLDLTDSDHKAIADFTGFCAALQQNTQAFFVAGGKDQLADSIVAMMAEHGVTDPEIKPLQEETLWELYLRRAGMNAFAAQAILAALRPDPGHAAVEFAFAEFVKMSVAQRVTRFEALMGGRRVLKMASARLDAQW